MTAAQALQYALSGVTVGSIYAITAIGFNIIYSTTGVINFAQGEFAVIGALTAISLVGHMPLGAAVALAVAITAALGALIELLVVRRVKQASVLRLVVVTIGLSIVLREAALHVWDEKVHCLPFFTGNEVSSIAFLGAHISPQVLWVLGTCSAMVALLAAFFRFTATGRAMRACAANATAARLCGVNVRAMVTLSFTLSAALGALAGCVISPVTQTQYDMGAPLAIKGFTAAILGGLGNSAGAVGAGLTIGLLEAFSVSVLPLAYQDAVSIAVLLLVLVFRPHGLFTRRDAGQLAEK
ncbi:MAG: branched-chain amino acid ABC transporter permease [Burkholderiaceae bacterium]|nr:branched-chain amino acid ABC transporter permease [Burkholderiaceae bacterium]